jgi:transcriptional regulator with XRE-family HTH domain
MTEISMPRTPKARALGAALRQAREDKHMLLRQLGAAVNRDIGVLSRWENGERTPKPEQVAQILTTLGVNGERYDEIMTLAYGTDEGQWVATTLPEQRQQMISFTNCEQAASRIVEVAPLLVPGLLQTRDYAYSIMVAPGSGVPSDEVATRVAARLARRDVITKPNPATLLVLLSQSALTHVIGGRHVMLGQLKYLLEMAARPNIELRIIPGHCGWHPGLDGPFILIEPNRATKSSSIVFVGNRRTILMLHDEGDVRAYQGAIDDTLKLSLPPEVSSRLIADLHNRMEKHRDN